jgi:hypothetical protein
MKVIIIGYSKNRSRGKLSNRTTNRYLVKMLREDAQNPLV